MKQKDRRLRLTFVLVLLYFYQAGNYASENNTGESVMKKSEIVPTLELGTAIIMGTYHGGAARKQTIFSKRDGKKRDATVARQVILTAIDTVAVTEWLDDDFKPEDWKASAKKGDTVVVKIQEMEMSNGSLVITRGTIEPVIA